MSKQKKPRSRVPVSPRPVEPEMGVAFPEPCVWPLAWHGEALYSRPIRPLPAGRAGSEHPALADR